jgi:hypothetical protein
MEPVEEVDKWRWHVSFPGTSMTWLKTAYFLFLPNKLVGSIFDCICNRGMVFLSPFYYDKPWDNFLKFCGFNRSLCTYSSVIMVACEKCKELLLVRNAIFNLQLIWSLNTVQIATANTPTATINTPTATGSISYCYWHYFNTLLYSRTVVSWRFSTLQVTSSLRCAWSCPGAVRECSMWDSQGSPVITHSGVHMKDASLS